MAKKSNKVGFSDCVITEESGEFFVKIKEEEEEPKTINLSNEIRKYLNQEGMNFKLGKKGKAPKRKPTYKYQCHECKKEVTSKEENLDAQCLDCKTDFIKKEDK